MFDGYEVHEDKLTVWRLLVLRVCVFVDLTSIGAGSRWFLLLTFGIDRDCGVATTHDAQGHEVKVSGS